MNKKAIHVVFDLDDTLYSEVTYVHSAFVFIGLLISETFGLENPTLRLWQLFKAGDKNPILTFWSENALPTAAMKDRIAAMRAHRPNIAPHDGARELISTVQQRGIAWSILTDGRSLTQRQKIGALELGEQPAGIYISEERLVSKPNPTAYRQIERDFPLSGNYMYVGDNPIKDFVAANKLGWVTVMLRDNGHNTHCQRTDLPQEMHPLAIVDSLAQVIEILDNV